MFVTVTSRTSQPFSLWEELRAIVSHLNWEERRQAFRFSHSIAGASTAVIEARILITRLRSYRSKRR